MQKEQQSKFNKIAVFCASSDGNDANIIENARALGQTLAKRSIGLVYGGSKIGLMGHVANSCLENNGEVTGVIPDFLKTKEVAHTGLNKLITTKDMHERKLKMHDLSDAFIALPGGFGTFEELFEILTWAQLGLHQKPIGILNSNGFYDDLLEMLKTMVRKGLLKKTNFDLLQIGEDHISLLDKMENFKTLPVEKPMRKDQT